MDYIVVEFFGLFLFLRCVSFEVFIGFRVVFGELFRVLNVVVIVFYKKEVILCGISFFKKKICRVKMSCKKCM